MFGEMFGGAHFGNAVVVVVYIVDNLIMNIIMYPVVSPLCVVGVG